MQLTALSTPYAAPRDQFYTVKEAAAILKISDDTLRRMMDGGMIEYSRVGKRLRRISQQALDKFARGN